MHEDRGSFLHLCCTKKKKKGRAAEAPARRRWREGARKKAFVLPLPPIKAKGKCLSREEVREPHRAVHNCRRAISAARGAACTPAARARPVHLKVNTLLRGSVAFPVSDLPPFAQFLVRRCCSRARALARSLAHGCRQ